MGLSGALKEVALKKCPHCKKEYGKHSRKQFMKCLYTANYNLYHLLQEYNKIKADAKESSEVKPEGEGIAQKVS